MIFEQLHECDSCILGLTHTFFYDTHWARHGPVNLTLDTVGLRTNSDVISDVFFARTHHGQRLATWAHPLIGYLYKYGTTSPSIRFIHPDRASQMKRELTRYGYNYPMYIPVRMTQDEVLKARWQMMYEGSIFGLLC